MNKEEQLNNLHAKWITKCTCQLRYTATRPVPGAGHPNADIVFIGEAPGKKEDETGEPFVGRAGKFLDEMLATISLKRSDVYITNTVKYRPPNNRDPKPEEVAACWDWLTEELNLIQPAVIVMLGRHALNRFFPKEKISDVHGMLLTQTIEGLDTQNFVALYHPAAALYNGGMRTNLLDDFKKLQKIITNIKKGSDRF